MRIEFVPQSNCVNALHLDQNFAPSLASLPVERSHHHWWVWGTRGSPLSQEVCNGWWDPVNPSQGSGNWTELIHIAQSVGAEPKQEEDWELGTEKK